MKIPSADGFGNVVTDPVKLDRRTTKAEAFGEGIGRALTSIGLDGMAQQRAEQQEAERTRDAADKAMAVRDVHAARDSLNAAHDEIVEMVRTGELPKGEAANRWQERSKEIGSSFLEGAPTKYVPEMQADIDSQGARFTRGVQKAVTLRDQADVREGINSTFEASSRLYLKDPAAAQEMLDGALTELGPHSGLAPDALAKLKQNWTETTRFTAAGELILGARRDNKALTKVEQQLQSSEFAALDPQKRVQLMTQIEGFKVSNDQHAEAQVRRAEAAQERHLRQAEAQFNAASSIITTGKVLSPEYVQQVSAAVTGTPYELAFREQLKQAPERTAFGMQPLSVMERTLNQARAQLNTTGTSKHSEEQIKKLEQIRDQAKKDYAEDPLVAAQERGILPSIEPIDVSSVQGLVATIGKRTEQAGLVATQTGGPVSPLLKSEAEQVSRALGILPMEQRSTAVAQIAQAVGPQQAAALGKQMAPKDKALGIALGMAGDRTSAGRYTSEIVLRGAQAIKDKAVKEDGAAITGIRARVAAEIGDAYVNQELRQTMIDAAVFAEYGLQSEGNGNPTNAVRLVTGGITERGGKKVPLPYGMDAETFDKRITQLAPPDLASQLPDGKVYANGTAMTPADLLKQLPKTSLLHAGQGRYAIPTGNGIVTNSVGRPVYIEVK